MAVPVSVKIPVPITGSETQELDISVIPAAAPVTGTTPKSVIFGKPGGPQMHVGLSLGAVTSPPPPPPPPPPPSDAPNISAAILASAGITKTTRIDPGDSVMLNPSHWKLDAHSQGNGSATVNNPQLAKYGQSYYGGPTDAYLHCSIANGQGLWMVGDELPASGKYIVGFSAKCGGSKPTQAYGWGLGWVLAPNGQEDDIEESVNWDANKLSDGYASSTYRDRAGHVVNSFYDPSFPVADGQFHEYYLIWDMDNAKQYLVWDDVVKVNGLGIVNPGEQMQLQIMTGYTAGTATQPPSWDASSDNVYQWYRIWEAS